MKRFVKLCSIVLLVMMLSGCASYEETYNQYGHILENIDCAYTGTVDGQEYTLEFGADSESFYVYVNGEKKDIYNSNGLNAVQIGNYNVNFTDQDLQELLTYYDDDDERYVCPPNMFISVDVNQAPWFKTTCSVNAYTTECISFQASSGNNTTTDNISYSQRYTKMMQTLDRNEVTFYFGYNFDTGESYLFTNNCNENACNRYVLNNNAVYVGIDGYNYIQLAISPEDYSGLFDIDEENRTVNWPSDSQVNIGRRFEGEYTVLHITTSTNQYSDYDNTDYNENIHANDDAFNPNRVCGEGENCNISVRALCNDHNVARTLRGIGVLIIIIKVLVPAVIIIIGFKNLFQIIVSGKEDDAKKYVKSIVYRMGIGVVIFLLPSIITFIYNIASDVIDSSGGDGDAFNNCWNCVMDIDNCVQ